MSVSDTQEWILKLEDKLSGPASKAEKHLGFIEERLEKLSKIELGETIVEGIIKIGEVAFEVGKKIAETGYELLKFGVEEAGAKEHTVATFRALLGSEEAARGMVEEVERLVPALALTEESATNSARRLLAVGFAREDIPTYLRAISDAAAATGASAEQVDGAVGALRRIKNEGKLTTKAMKALGDVGVPVDVVYKRIAKDLGVTEKQARALAKAGKVSAEEGLFSIVGAVAEARSGGELGSVGEAWARDTFLGLKKNFDFFKKELFGDVFATAGFGVFKSFWANVNEALNPEGATGKRIRDRVSDTFSRVMGSIFGPLEGESGLVRIENLVNRAMDAVEALIAGGRVLYNVFEGFVGGALRGFGIDVNKLLGAGGALDPANVEHVAELAHGVGEEFGYIAGKIEGAIDRAAKFLGLLDENPLMRAAAWTAEKFWGSGGGEEKLSAEGLTRYVQAVTYSPTPSATAGQVAGARTASSHNEAHVAVHVHGQAAADPRAIGQAAAAGTSSALSGFEHAAQAMGALGDD